MALSDLPIIDCHVHFGDVKDADLILSIMREANFERMNLVSIISPNRVNFNPEEMYMKAAYPSSFYIFGGLDYSSILLGLGRAEPRLTEQVDALIKIGFDGVKMVEGKPLARKILMKPFDSEFYKEYFEYLETLQFPLLFHVNDPEEFWDPDKVPEWAKQRGWYYDSTYPTKEELYMEVGRVLENSPKLKVIFAHFYFLSGDLERAASLLDNYRNVHLDITPGSEMYYNFSAKREEWRAFFIKYQDRILYGTDINNGMPLEEAVNHANRIRRFLETDEPIRWGTYPGKDEPLIGLKLPEHVTRKIYSENFKRIVGTEPRPLNLEAAIDECLRLARLVSKIKVKGEYRAVSWIRPRVKNPAKYVADLLMKMKRSRDS